jgi:hypothetical protein
MPLFRALAKNMAASYFDKKAPYGFVMEVTLLYVFILCSSRPSVYLILWPNCQSQGHLPKCFAHCVAVLVPKATNFAQNVE